MRQLFGLFLNCLLVTAAAQSNVKICSWNIPNFGKWLECLGFYQGKKVLVEASDKKLVITLIEEPAILSEKPAHGIKKPAAASSEPTVPGKKPGIGF